MILEIQKTYFFNFCTLSGVFPFDHFICTIFQSSIHITCNNFFKFLYVPLWAACFMYCTASTLVFLTNVLLIMNKRFLIKTSHLRMLTGWLTLIETLFEKYLARAIPSRTNFNSCLNFHWGYKSGKWTEFQTEDPGPYPLLNGGQNLSTQVVLSLFNISLHIVLWIKHDS